MELEFDSLDGQQEFDSVLWANIYEHGKAILALRTVKDMVSITKFPRGETCSSCEGEGVGVSEICTDCGGTGFERADDEEVSEWNGIGW